MKHPLTIDISGRVRITSNSGGDCILTAAPDGLSSPASELRYQENALLAGGSIGGSRAMMRRITLQFVLPGRTWHEASSLFPLGRMERITVKRGGTVRYIHGYRDGPLVPIEQSANSTPHVQVSFLCGTSYFVRDVLHRHEFMHVESGLEYPKEYPISYGQLASNDRVFCTNAGDYPAPFELDLRSSANGAMSVIVGTQRADIVGISVGDSITLNTDTRMLWVNGKKRFDMFRGVFPLIPVGGADVVLDRFVGTAQIAYSEIFEGV